MSATDLKEDLARYARSLGFERFGVTSAQSLKKEEAYLKQWVAEGRAGDMDYMERAPERRARPAELLPGAKSVIALAMSYSMLGSSSPAVAGRGSTAVVEFMDSPPEAAGNDVVEGRVARYARGRDYHKVIKKRLEGFVRYLKAIAPDIECRTFVDTGPLLERALAQRAGLGFIGKNTMLITKGLGSWVFLASVITTLDLAPDTPDERSCGECRLCIDACPTQAITAPFKLDARLCIAYLTIEKDGPFPEPLRGKTGPWVFGCDICQEVCPHNALSFRRKPVKLSSPAGVSGGSIMMDPGLRPAGMTARLAEILSISTDEEFRERFGGTALTRAGREGLVRNACVAAANLGRDDLLPQLEKLAAQDPDPVVREHARWAIERLTNRAAPIDTTC